MAEERARRGQRQTELVVTKRISAIYDLYVAGKRSPEIMRAVTKQAADETALREKARKDGKKSPPFVWGEEPLPMRTFYFYLGKAKKRLVEEAKALTKPGQGDFILAKNFARQDDIYARALEVGRYEVCRKIITDQLTLCGLMGVVKVQLSALDAEPQEGEEKEVTNAERTLPEIVRDQMALLDKARIRMGLKPLSSPTLKLVSTGTG